MVASQSGECEPRRRLVEAFMPSIGGVARRYVHAPGVERQELLQEGVVGLLQAAGRYDPEMGTPFWGYACWWVRQAMQQLVSEMTRPIVLSDRGVRRLAQIKRARQVHVQERGGEPTSTDLAEATGLGRLQVEDLLAVEARPRSLEEPAGGETDAAETVGDRVADPDAEAEYGRVADRMEIAAISGLTTDLEARERAIVQAHYGLGRETQTLKQIAEGLTLSVERVRQIEVEALGKIRDIATTPALH
ncbi:sigma-70 family RNA polymerase sigma factor [Thermoleophilia bacterium SCSIO 60948]|nr:sigma-70 family RNA polymerase sigma factor [Thermoleophilia bacterium SCSIO 60948]